jgi:hypothetical protein
MRKCAVTLRNVNFIQTKLEEFMPDGKYAVSITKTNQLLLFR